MQKFQKGERQDYLLRSTAVEKSRQTTCTLDETAFRERETQRSRLMREMNGGAFCRVEEEFCKTSRSMSRARIFEDKDGSLKIDRLKSWSFRARVHVSMSGVWTCPYDSKNSTSNYLRVRVVLRRISVANEEMYKNFK